jgi:hypothetical protein
MYVKTRAKWRGLEQGIQRNNQFESGKEPTDKIELRGKVFC